MWNINYWYFIVGTQESNAIVQDNKHTQEGYLKEYIYALYAGYRERCVINHVKRLIRMLDIEIRREKFVLLSEE